MYTPERCIAAPTGAQKNCSGCWVKFLGLILGYPYKYSHVQIVLEFDTFEDIDSASTESGSIQKVFIGDNGAGYTKLPTVSVSKTTSGSGTKLIAPLEVGENSTIGSGSVITKDVVPNKLTLSRVKQVVVDNWKRKR